MSGTPKGTPSRPKMAVESAQPPAVTIATSAAAFAQEMLSSTGQIASVVESATTTPQAVEPAGEQQSETVTVATAQQASASADVDMEAAVDESSQDTLEYETPSTSAQAVEPAATPPTVRRQAFKPKGPTDCE